MKSTGLIHLLRLFLPTVLKTTNNVTNLSLNSGQEQGQKFFPPLTERRCLLQN